MREEVYSRLRSLNFAYVSSGSQDLAGQAFLFFSNVSKKNTTTKLMVIVYSQVINVPGLGRDAAFRHHEFHWQACLWAWPPAERAPRMLRANESLHPS